MLYHVHRLGPMRLYDLEAKDEYAAVLAMLDLVGYGRNQQGEHAGPTGAVARAEGSLKLYCFRISYDDETGRPVLDLWDVRDWVPPIGVVVPTANTVRTGACDGRCHCPCHGAP